MRIQIKWLSLKAIAAVQRTMKPAWYFFFRKGRIRIRETEEVEFRQFKNQLIILMKLDKVKEHFTDHYQYVDGWWLLSYLSKVLMKSNYFHNILSLKHFWTHRHINLFWISQLYWSAQKLEAVSVYVETDGHAQIG